MIVTTEDLYTVPAWNGRFGYCAKGTRAWMAAAGLSWADFVAHGLDESVFVATGDPMAIRLVEHARRRHGKE